MRHDFQKSLKRSQQMAGAPWWFEVYREAFPNLESAVNVREDGWAQRAGIDRVLTLSSGKTLTVDEKVRERDWPDIALEYWSDFERRTPGWIAKELATDYLAYAFIPSRVCYLFPFQTLRAAWRENHADWVRCHKRIEADNGNYTTMSVAVPIPELMKALTDAMRVTWSASVEASADGLETVAQAVNEQATTGRDHSLQGSPQGRSPVAGSTPLS